MTPKSKPMIEWDVASGVVDYAEAVAAMEARVAAIADGCAAERVWLVEHAAIYTAGTSARAQDLIDPERFPVYATGRGGEYTYHGPGQRVAYVMLNLKARGGDVRAFVGGLEAWIIAALAEFGVVGAVRPGRVGVWIERRRGGGAASEAKIAAIGIRVRRGVTYHGISLNVSPNLTHFEGIVPCGLPDTGVTSLADLGVDVRQEDVDNALRQTFEAQFGATKMLGAALSGTNI